MTKPEFSVGDRVAWKYGVGKGKGHIKEKVTKTTKLYGKNFKASAEEPKYRVKSDKGKDVIRNPEALEMLEEAGDDKMDEEEEAQEGPSEDEEDPVEDVEGNEEKEEDEEALISNHREGEAKAKESQNGEVSVGRE